MHLILQVRSQADRAAGQRQRQRFDTFPVTLGRSDACQFRLEDASRYISSNHALISREGAQLLIEDTSANGVYVNGSADPIGRGRVQPLHHGDTLAIGDYIVDVSIEQESENNAVRAHDSEPDPFADLASSPTRALGPEATEGYDPFKGDEPDWTPPSASSNVDDFADDWDLDTPQANSAGTSSADDADWANWPDVPASPESRPGSVSAAAQPHESAGSHAPTDELDWFAEPDTPPADSREREQARAPAAASDRRDRARRARPAPAAADGRAASRARRPPAPASPPAASAEYGASLSTLLRAAGLKDSDFAHLSDEQVLAQTGRLLAQMVDAMMVLLQSRTELKNAIRSDVTTLSRTNNNPLKFSFDARDALTRLLSGQQDGYLEPELAVEQAIEDLKLHQLAMIDGMKSAVRSVLLQFDPDSLSRTLEKTGGISANIPITREAKLWELFCEQYDTIRDEAMHDFTEVYGREFRKAYEARIRKARREPDF